MEKRIVLMVGFPGAGKSTYVQQIKDGKILLSLDQVRKVVYKEDYNQAMDYIAIKTHHYMLEYLLKQEHDIIIDGTNTRSYVRQEMVKLARLYGYKIEAHFIDTPIEICMRRALDEDLKHLVAVIQKQSDYFDRQSFLNNSDGFDKVEVIPWKNS